MTQQLLRNLPSSAMAFDQRYRHGSVAGFAVAALFLLSACSSGQQTGPEATVEGTQHVCSSCHGFGGRSVNPTFPRLAGQQKDYLVTQLKSFRDKTRADPHAHTYMWGMAARLSDTTIIGLADFYASQEPVAGSEGDPTEMAAGQKIFAEGLPAKGVPACAGCHGQKAEGNDAFPRLAGQHRSYLEDQLQSFASNERANEIMHETSKNLTTQQISQVAAYLAAQ